MVRLTDDALRACRARIAAARGTLLPPAALGSVTLRPHQRLAIARVTALLDEHRGCLLAEDVGRGKTFVALSVARRWRQPLVVVPAALRDTWERAMRRAGVMCPLLSHEALSRGAGAGAEHDGIIVDESHHFRNPGTRRYAALAALAARAELLLVSATPVQNGAADLASQLALWLGAVTREMDVSRLARHVVRIEGGDREAALPVMTPPRWVGVAADDGEVLEAVLALPAPPRALDVGDAGALRAITLVRAWASSRAALASALARRRRTAIAIGQGLDAGRTPTRAELRSWCGPDDDAVQLGFATLLATHATAAGAAAPAREALCAEQAALDRVARLLRERPDPDVERAAALASIARAHAGARVIAFTGLAATARAYHRALRAMPGVGLLTAEGARIASGRLARHELLARFAPAAHGLPEPPLRERVSLLVCTDLLSEGVNLQDAAVVVHLDLPWNPARLAQRVGRVRRPGGAARVHAYLIAPPAHAELLLDVERRLRRKLADAERLLGQGLDVVPALTLAGAARLAQAPAGEAVRHASVAARLDRWAAEPVDWEMAHAPMVAAAVSRRCGWLAMTTGGELFACIDDVTGDGARLLDEATRAAEGRARPVGECELARARAGATAELARRRALADCGTAELRSAVAALVERRLAALLQREGRERRAALTRAAAALRQRLHGALSLGSERALQALVAERAVAADEWMRRAAALLPPLPRRGATGDQRDALAVLVILGPASPVAPPQ